jgi:uncharacterized protein
MNVRVVSPGVFVAALFTACSVLEPRPDPSRFFTLTPIADVPAVRPASPVRTLGIGPITFPRYLDRPEIVTRVGPNEVRNATSDYWAGSLAKQFETTLAQNLQNLVAPSSMVTYPWYAATAPDVIVEIDVVQFERAADGQAHLVARWRVKNSQAARIARGAESSLSRPAAGDPASAVAALSELLGELSRQIAAAITTAGVTPQGPPTTSRARRR